MAAPPAAEREQAEREKQERQEEDVPAGRRKHDHGDEKSDRDCADHLRATFFAAALGVSRSVAASRQR